MNEVHIVHNKFMPSGLKNYYFPISPQYWPIAHRPWVVILSQPRPYNDQEDHYDNTEQSHVIGDCEELYFKLNDDGISLPHLNIPHSKYVH